MTAAPATSAARGPLVFAGRVLLEDPGAPVVTEALPRAIRPADPSHWVIVDPVAFPFDAMSDRHWDAPISVVLPTDLGADGLVAVLGQPLLGSLTPFDVVVSPAWLWHPVQREYALAETQWRPPRGRADLVVRELVAAAERADQLAGVLEDDRTPEESARLVSRWDVRTRALKARYQAELAALAPMLRRALNSLPPGRSGLGVEFSDDVHGFVSHLGRAMPDVVVARRSGVVGGTAALAYPSFASPCLDTDGSLGLRPEHADVAVGLLEDADDDAVAFVGEVWAGLRVGGSMLVVLRADPEAWTLPAVTRLVLDISAGSAVATEVGGVRDPKTGRGVSAVLAYTKTGAPTTW